MRVDVARWLSSSSKRAGGVTSLIGGFDSHALSMYCYDKLLVISNVTVEKVMLYAGRSPVLLRTVFLHCLATDC